MWTLIVIASITISAGNSQSDFLQSPEQFLQWFLKTTTRELNNFTDSFNVRNVTSSDVKFYYYPPKNDTPILITEENRAKLIDPDKETKIVIHGWQANGTDEETNKLAKAYHKRGGYNVIAVDWSEQSRKNYAHAAQNVGQIGALIGQFVLSLGNRPHMRLKSVHLIGHSLGGHLAGFAGKHVRDKSQNGTRMGRITGLDVAGPMFEMANGVDTKRRLDEGDADFVDVIHTNAGFLGALQPLGTVDFYVENGGPIQPGCINLLNFFDSVACSHMKAFELFRRSVEGREYQALSCPNSIDYHLLQCVNNRIVPMGETVPRNATGVYYLETNSALPYRSLFT